MNLEGDLLGGDPWGFCRRPWTKFGSGYEQNILHAPRKLSVFKIYRLNQ